MLRPYVLAGHKVDSCVALAPRPTAGHQTLDLGMVVRIHRGQLPTSLANQQRSQPMKPIIAAATFVMTFAGGALAQGPQMPKPGPEHQRLHYYVGEWKSEGAMKPSAYGPGGTSKIGRAHV